jgi:ATP-binding cassette, subfamily F, member 3
VAAARRSPCARTRPSRPRPSSPLRVLTASGLTKRIGARTLFADLAFKLATGDRLTLAGRNGSGKTTLLRILAGELAADEGTLSIAPGVRIALHDQRPPRSDASLRDYVGGGLAWIEEIEAELARLEGEMASGASDQRTLDAYAQAQARLEHAGGYRWRDGIGVALHGLGFTDDELDRPLSTFSGGELTRASLARALTSKPDLLLLDEPTNHLDIESLEWLETYLTELDAAVVLVAHDRWFLESVGTSVLELEAGRGRFFAGPWHAWRAEQAARELALGRDAARREAQITRLERFVERFRYKATKARQAQSKLKSIERLRRDAPEVDPRDNRTLHFSFGAAERSGRVVLELADARVEAGDKTLLDDAEMWLERGEHVTLVGANGSGKTTLVETLAGRREPAAGKLSRGHNVSLGYLSQHAELPGAAETTLLSHAQRATGLSEAKTRALLGRFLFSGEDVEKRLGELSGGEARRLALALLTNSDANVLILDEPTNHLDLESREALEDALCAFEGTVLLISHDRALLEAVGNRTLVIEDCGLHSHSGGWAEYRSRVEAEREERAAAPRRGSRRARAKAGGPSKNRRALIERLEAEAEAAQAAFERVERELSDPSHWSTPERSAESSRRHEEARLEAERAFAAWEDASEPS